MILDTGLIFLGKTPKLTIPPRRTRTMMRVGMPMTLKKPVAAKLTEGLAMPGISDGELK